MRISKLAFVTAWAAAMIAATATSAASLVNGSFETCDSCTQTGGFAVLNRGSDRLTGWKITANTANAVDWVGSYWQAASGDESIALSGLAHTKISQTFATVIDQTYDVTFDLAGNPAGTVNPIKTIFVDVKGSPTKAYSFNVTGHTTANMGWVDETYVFTATGDLSTLAFFVNAPGHGKGGSPFGVALDNINVSAVPEPASWAMMIIGIGLAGAGLRRRSANQATSPATA